MDLTVPFILCNCTEQAVEKVRFFTARDFSPDFVGIKMTKKRIAAQLHQGGSGVVSMKNKSAPFFAFFPSQRQRHLYSKQLWGFNNEGIDAFKMLIVVGIYRGYSAFQAPVCH